MKESYKKAMMMLVGGKKQVDIAKELDITPSRLSCIVNAPLFQYELAKLRKNVTDEFVAVEANVDPVAKALKVAALDAANELVGELKDDDVKTRHLSCKEILDRTGYGKKVIEEDQRPQISAKALLELTNAMVGFRKVKTIDVKNESA